MLTDYKRVCVVYHPRWSDALGMFIIYAKKKKKHN